MATPLTRGIALFLLPPILMTALAFLVKGYSGPGDGFSAGAIAAIGVLLQYVALGYRGAERMLPVRLAPVMAVLGLGLALVVAFAPTLLGEPIMTHFPPPGGPVVRLGSLELITAVLFDVGVFLLVMGFSVGVIGAIAHTIEEQEPDEEADQ
jgi:multisubunit Na+/H+ antiporter MnhB subunit